MEGRKEGGGRKASPQKPQDMTMSREAVFLCSVPVQVVHLQADAKMEVERSIALQCMVSAIQRLVKNYKSGKTTLAMKNCNCRFGR